MGQNNWEQVFRPSPAAPSTAQLSTLERRRATEARRSPLPRSVRSRLQTPRRPRDSRRSPSPSPSPPSRQRAAAATRPPHLPLPLPGPAPARLPAASCKPRPGLQLARAPGQGSSRSAAARCPGLQARGSRPPRCRRRPAAPCPPLLPLRVRVQASKVRTEYRTVPYLVVQLQFSNIQ